MENLAVSFEEVTKEIVLRYDRTEAKTPLICPDDSTAIDIFMPGNDLIGPFGCKIIKSRIMLQTPPDTILAFGKPKSWDEKGLPLDILTEPVFERGLLQEIGACIFNTSDKNVRLKENEGLMRVQFLHVKKPKEIKFKHELMIGCVDSSEDSSEGEGERPDDGKNQEGKKIAKENEKKFKPDNQPCLEPKTDSPASPPLT